MTMPSADPRALRMAAALRAGDVGALEQLLAEHGELATARFVDPKCGGERTALHVLTDSPGHAPTAARWSRGS